MEIAKNYLPCIYRIVKGKRLRLTSFYHSETLMVKYLDFLNWDNFFIQTILPCHYISKAEELLLNYINQNHSGEECKLYVFTAGKDFINNVEDILKFYTMINAYSIQLQYKMKYFNKKSHGLCMFSMRNVTLILPYILIDETKYVPLFYLDGFQYKSIRLLDLYNSSIDMNYLNFSYLSLYCNIHICNDQYFCFDESLNRNAFVNGLNTLSGDIINRYKTRYSTYNQTSIEMLFNLTNAYFENYYLLINFHQTIKVKQIEMIKLKSIEQTNIQTLSTVLTVGTQAITLPQDIQCTNIINQNEKSTNQMVPIKYLIN